jgi:hypothetical protein
MVEVQVMQGAITCPYFLYIVTSPSMALCDIRPPWMVEVQILPGANICPLIPEHTRTAILGSLRYTVHPVHKKKPTLNGWLKRVLHYEKNSLLALTTCTHTTISI